MINTNHKTDVLVEQRNATHFCSEKLNDDQHEMQISRLPLNWKGLSPLSIKLWEMQNMLVVHVKNHYNDVIKSAMTSQITSLAIVYSIVYSGADQWKHQSSASLAFVKGIHRWPLNSLHKGPVTRKKFLSNYVIMDPILWFVIHQYYPYPSGLLHRYWRPIPVKNTLRLCVNIFINLLVT